MPRPELWYIQRWDQLASRATGKLTSSNLKCNALTVLGQRRPWLYALKTGETSQALVACSLKRASRRSRRGARSRSVTSSVQHAKSVLIITSGPMTPPAPEHALEPSPHPFEDLFSTPQCIVPHYPTNWLATSFSCRATGKRTSGNRTRRRQGTTTNDNERRRTTTNDEDRRRTATTNDDER